MTKKKMILRIGLAITISVLGLVPMTIYFYYFPAAVNFARKISSPAPPQTLPPRFHRQVLDEGGFWAPITSSISPGILVFDENNDGRQDLILFQNGIRPRKYWAAPEYKDKLYHHSQLFLNQTKSQDSLPKFQYTPSFLEKIETSFRRPTNDQLVAPLGNFTGGITADLDGDGQLEVILFQSFPGTTMIEPNTFKTMFNIVNPMAEKVFWGAYKFTSSLQPLWQDMAKPSLKERKHWRKNLVFKKQKGEWTRVDQDWGIFSQQSTTTGAIADVDLDGDLDIYFGNIMDFDYWTAGSGRCSGGRNELFINQLAETGKIGFIEAASAWGVDEDYTLQDPRKFHRFSKSRGFLSYFSPEIEEFQPPHFLNSLDEVTCASVTWSTFFQDVNNDGFPDLWVGNDLDQLHLYINQLGQSFRLQNFPHQNNIASNMTFAAADFDGDGSEEVFIGNLSELLPHVVFSPKSYQRLFDPDLEESYGLLTYNRKHQFISTNTMAALTPKVFPAKIWPANGLTFFNDQFQLSNLESIRTEKHETSSLNPYSFASSATVIDVENNGLPDLFFLGSLYGRFANNYSNLQNPGRLLINQTQSVGHLAFQDLTMEYGTLNIDELDFEKLHEGIVRRKVPSLNKGRENKGFLSSRDVKIWNPYGQPHNYVYKNKSFKSLLSASESGRAVATADFNNDGFQDLIIRNIGGFDSRDSQALEMTAHENMGIHLEKTSWFYPGPTFIFTNQETEGNWLKLRLRWKDRFNTQAIGARIVLNHKFVREIRTSQGTFASQVADALHFGLGADKARHLHVRLPNIERKTFEVQLSPVANKLLTLEISGSKILCHPQDFCAKVTE